MNAFRRSNMVKLEVGKLRKAQIRLLDKYTQITSENLQILREEKDRFVVLDKETGDIVATIGRREQTRGTRTFKANYISEWLGDEALTSKRRSFLLNFTSDNDAYFKKLRELSESEEEPQEKWELPDPEPAKSKPLGTKLLATLNSRQHELSDSDLQELFDALSEALTSRGIHLVAPQPEQARPSAPDMDEIDRLLDKVATEGEGALTPSEKELLSGLSQ